MNGMGNGKWRFTLKRLRGIALAAGLAGCGLAGSALGAEPGAEGYLLKWYGWADVSAMPPLQTYYCYEGDALRTLCDGTVAGAEFSGGPEVGARLAFDFPEALDITRFRIRLSGAKTFRLEGDADGDRTYKTVLATIKRAADTTGDEWTTIEINRKLRGLRFVALEGTAGYRAPFPYLQEVEIYTAAPVKMAAPKREEAPPLVASDYVPMPGDLKRRSVEFIMCTDFWMAGINSDGRNLPDNLVESSGFKYMLGQLKYLGVDTVRIMPEVSCCENKMPWPSKIAPHIKKNVLKAYVDALHESGYPVYLFLHAWISPIQTEPLGPMPYRRWDYPYEQSDRFKDPKFKEQHPHQYPCIISENDFYDKWMTLMNEAIDNGVDGVYFAPDEYYYKGHNLPKTDCPACTKAFKERFGQDRLPAKPADALAYRQWKTFEYERVYELFDRMAAELLKKKPDLVLPFNICYPKEILYNRRMEHGMCLDIDMARMNPKTTVYAGSGQWFARRAASTGRPLLLHHSGFYGNRNTSRSVSTVGRLCSEVMNGAAMISMYRVGRVFDNGWAPDVRKAIRMVRVLESWGLGASTVPSDVCVLLSRASEDWYELKVESLLGGTADDVSRGQVLFQTNAQSQVGVKDAGDAKRELAYEAFRGFYANQSLEMNLYNNGLQYEARWTDLPNTLADLKKFKVLVIPFSYSMSTQAFTAVKAAVDEGSKLLVYDQLAPTDEWGEPYKEPLLKGLLGNTNVVYMPTDLAREGMHRQVREEMLKKIGELQGNTGYFFNRSGADIEYQVRCTKDGDFILELIDWDTSGGVSPVIGLPVDEKAKYKVTVCDSEQDLLAVTEAPGRSLKRFALPMNAGQVKLLHIQAVK